MTQASSQATPAGPFSSPQIPVVTVFSSDEADDNWSNATSVLPSPPEVQAPSNLPTSVTLCIPHPIHKHPFIIPSTISLSQYSVTFLQCQFCHFAPIADAEMFIWTEIRKCMALLVHSVLRVHEGHMPLPPQWHPQAFSSPVPPLMPTFPCSMAPTITPTHPYVYNVPPHPTVPTMLPNVTGPTFPNFPSPTGFPVPVLPTMNPSSLFGQSMMPIYIEMESIKLKIPDDWDGTKETWPLFKMRMEMACQKVNMTFLTTDATTTELTA
jgi:hypothetical protein